MSVTAFASALAIVTCVRRLCHTCCDGDGHGCQHALLPAEAIQDTCFGLSPAMLSTAETVLLFGLAAAVLWTVVKSMSSEKAKHTATQRVTSDSTASDFVVPYHCGQESDDSKEEHVRFVHERLPVSVLEQRSKDYADFLNQRRSLRFFSRDPVPLSIVENCVRAAGTAPSGAHCQPWTFVVVKTQSVKAEIRACVEEEEKKNYAKRMGDAWVSDVQPLVSQLHASGVEKPYLEEAPYLIVVLKQAHGLDRDGNKIRHWYPTESIGLACGMLLTALHNANLVTLTSTPLGAERKIQKILNRPANEKVFLLMPVGFPASNATVPNRSPQELRKPITDVMVVV